jgi:hypothetical protein
VNFSVTCFLLPGERKKKVLLKGFDRRAYAQAKAHEQAEPKRYMIDWNYSPFKVEEPP